jgi:glutathione S-transferase
MPSTSHAKTTIWLWPTGLFPRRIIYFFCAKNITTSILSTYNVHLVPVTISDTGLISLPGYEVRPEGTSLPLMRIETNGEDGEDNSDFWIRESAAIMDYLEELFNIEQGYKSVLGDTVLQRARCRDVLSLLGDAMVWSGVHLIHSNVSTTSWSGLKEEDMSASAAAHADKKFRALMGKLEGCVEGDIVMKGSKSLAGGDNVTMADIAFMANVQYFGEMYGMDWISGFEVLKCWYERVQNEDCVVKNETLAEAETTGRWEAVLG